MKLNGIGSSMQRATNKVTGRPCGYGKAVPSVKRWRGKQILELSIMSCFGRDVSSCFEYPLFIERGMALAPVKTSIIELLILRNWMRYVSLFAKSNSSLGKTPFLSRYSIFWDKLQFFQVVPAIYAENLSLDMSPILGCFSTAVVV